MKKKTFLEKIILEEVEKFKLENDNLIQDPTGGMIRPDQMKMMILDDLKKCLMMVGEYKQFNISSLLKITAMRADVLAELYEDDDDI